MKQIRLGFFITFQKFWISSYAPKLNKTLSWNFVELLIMAVVLIYSSCLQYNLFHNYLRTSSVAVFSRHAKYRKFFSSTRKHKNQTIHIIQVFPFPVDCFSLNHSQSINLCINKPLLSPIQRWKEGFQFFSTQHRVRTKLPLTTHSNSRCWKKLINILCLWFNELQIELNFKSGFSLAFFKCMKKSRMKSAH